MEQAAYQIKDEIIELRRNFHQIPELSFCEFKTTELICAYLDKYNISYQMIDKTGVVATISGQKPGKTILLRADIDALPIQEKNKLSYTSKHDGCMHACGHDVHIACLLGAARILSEAEFSGAVKLVFQPGEETDGGALPMIEKGVLENPTVDAAFALHVEPLADVGTIQIRDGAIMASPDEFTMTVYGKGGHGSAPHQCVDPIAISAEIIRAFHAITRTAVHPMKPCVVSVCSVHAGNCPNVIPEIATMEGTVRSLDHETRKTIAKALQKTAESIACSMGGHCDFEFRALYPPTINTPEMNQIVVEAVKKISKIQKIETLEFSSMAGDDFAYFAERVPAAYFRLGVGNAQHHAPIHSPDFYVDEDSIPLGVAILAQTAIDYLKN